MYDYVIVGGGSAGCVLASRLSEVPDARVLLLEAGGPDDRREIHVPAAFSKLFKTPVDWNYSTVPQPRLDGRELYWPRGKVLGGSSSINAQVYTRGDRADFDGWAAIGNAGWGYADVLPYFKRMEHCERGGSEYRGSGGPVNVCTLRDPNPATTAFVEAAVACGIARCSDVNAASQDGVDHVQVTQRGGRRWSAAAAYLHPARRRPNLTVITGAHATRIVFEGSRAVGVEYLVGGRRETARASEEVLVSGGAVNSPQLLLLSGVGPADELRALGVAVKHDLPGVGRHLQDHLATAVIVHARRPISLLAAESPASILRYLFLRRGMLTSNVAEALAFVRSEPGLAASDLELIFAPVPFADHGLQRPAAHGFTVGAINVEPRSTGAITLRSPDPLAPPRIDPAYLSDPEGRDLRVLVEGLRLARRIAAAPPLADFVGAPMEPGPEVGDDDAALAAHVRARAETLYHPVGTCRMGAGDDAVVDPALRVRGLDGLRVVDASVMPAIVRAHTNAATLMIAERAADLVLGRAPLGVPSFRAAERGNGARV